MTTKKPINIRELHIRKGKNMAISTFKIQNIEIAPGKTPLVIPEIGINHNGSSKIAKKMVASAHRAGARLIKHQTHIVEDEMSAAAKKVIPGNADISIYDIMSSCALSEAEEKDLMQYTESLISEKLMVFNKTKEY